ncbi:MAG: EAL domain-containing protein [Xanthomonadaceae bacterium]|nr:EAL domain-containing protein [Xanthomonadaceae bacterium]
MFCIRKLIRRTRRPLEELTEATHRVAAGDYHSRVTPTGDEELRGLAVAFNGMTEQIGRRFETLAVLSKLDRHILKSSELEEIVQAVLKHARDMLPCELLAVLVFDENCADVARLHVARYAEEVITCETRVEVPAALGSLLDTCEPIVELQAGDAAFESVRDLISDWRADRRFGVLPIRTDKGVQGAVAIAYSTPNASDRASLDFALGLAERLAVAISNADRRHALVRQAHYDGLTGLPNRVLFKDRLAQRIAHGQRSRKQFALLFIDLDRFKNINDSFGHTSGDELLKGVAARFAEELSEMDTIARLGGDEFTIITSDIDSAADAANAAQTVLSALARPVLLGDIEHFVSASIGIAVYPQDGVTTDILLRNADIAMYRAKAAGAGRFAYYEEAMNREAMERVELESELRQALARDELSVVYQPRIDLRTGAIIGVEALSRWHHPRFGMVPPGRFIRVAEDSGLIIAIGDRVLREICSRYHYWRRAGIEVRRLAYNVSVRQLQAPGFTKTLREIVERTRIPRGVLEIEITESVLATDIDYLTAVLEELSAMGVKVAIDDFGTGYSSLSYLRSLPIDALKIDKSFLPPPGERTSAALCEAIIAMSRALNVVPIAEGVESPEQAAFLLANGCEIAQGFYFSRPVSAEDIVRRYGREAYSEELGRGAVG